MYCLFMLTTPTAKSHERQKPDTSSHILDRFPTTQVTNYAKIRHLKSHFLTQQHHFYQQITAFALHYEGNVVDVV